MASRGFIDKRQSGTHMDAEGYGLIWDTRYGNDKKQMTMSKSLQEDRRFGDEGLVQQWFEEDSACEEDESSEFDDSN